MASSQALSDPLPLNDFTPVKVFIDYKPDAKSGPYWHRYLLQIPDKKIPSVTKKFSKLMNYGWYSIFWNEEEVFVVFKDKIIKLPREKVWKSKRYEELRKYAFSHGLEKRYFDFNERFAHYEKLLKDYLPISRFHFKPHHAAFTVNNIKETTKWYKEKLGFKVTHEYSKHGSSRAIIELGQTRIELFSFGRDNKPLPEDQTDLIEGLHTVGVRHLCIEVDNLDKVVKKLNKKGVWTREIDTAGFGGRYSFFKDCNGILVELYER